MNILWFYCALAQIFMVILSQDGKGVVGFSSLVMLWLPFMKRRPAKYGFYVIN